MCKFSDKATSAVPKEVKGMIRGTGIALVQKIVETIFFKHQIKVAKKYNYKHLTEGEIINQEICQLLRHVDWWLYLVKPGTIKIESNSINSIKISFTHITDKGEEEFLFDHSF